MGHSRSLAMSPFDRAHTTAYSSLIKTTHLSCTILETASYFLKFANINLLHLHVPCSSRHTDCIAMLNRDAETLHHEHEGALLSSCSGNAVPQFSPTAPNVSNAIRVKSYSKAGSCTLTSFPQPRSPLRQHSESLCRGGLKPVHLNR